MTAINYSTTEVRTCDKWFEKPIYTKVLEIVGNGQQSIEVDLSTLNIDQLLPVEGFWNDGFNTHYLNTPIYNQVISSYNYEDGNSSLGLFAPNDIINSSFTYVVILKYTKIN